MKAIVNILLLSTFLLIKPVDAFDMSAQMKNYVETLKSQFSNSRDLSSAYNLARIYSLHNDKQQTLFWLNQLVSSDWNLGVEFADFTEFLLESDIRKVIDVLNERLSIMRLSKIAFEVDVPRLFPENIAYNTKTNSFYIGSLTLGKVYEYTKKGELVVFLDGAANGIGAIYGMKFDESTNQLWILSNPFNSSMSGSITHSEIIIANTQSQQIVNRIVSSEHEFGELNDLCLMNNQIYLTDSKNSAIYYLTQGLDKVIKLTFFDQKIKYPNGIACDDETNSLYIADFYGIHKFDIQNNSLSSITTSKGSFLTGIDGLYYADNSLVAIQNSLGAPRVIRVFPLETESYAKLELLESGNPDFDIPTTGVLVGTRFYYIANSQLTKLSSPTNTKTITKILKIEL